MSSLIDQLGALKPMELIALVKRLEEEWGVSSAPVAPQVIPAEQMPIAEPTVFTVTLVSFGVNKMQAIKEIRALLPGLGLLEAKKMVESAPVTVMPDVDKAKAEEAQKCLERVGAKVTVTAAG